MHPKTAIVSGAAGFLGASVVRNLLARGFAVRALVRTLSSAGRLAGLPVELIEQDVTRPIHPAAMSECEVVVHCAAATGVRRSRKDCEAINVGGTVHMLAAAALANVPRFVHVSSLSVYGMHAGAFDESSPMVRAGDPYGDTKVAAEERCAAFAHDMALSIVRPALIVGGGDTGFFPMFVDMLARRRFPLLNGGDVAARLVLVDDVAELIGRCSAVSSEAARPVGARDSHTRGVEIYNCCGSGELSWRSFADAVCDHFGFARPTLKLSAGPLYMVANAVQLLERAGIRPPMRKTDLQFLGEQRSYSTERARAELAFEARSALECVATTLSQAPARDDPSGQRLSAASSALNFPRGTAPSRSATPPC